AGRTDAGRGQQVDECRARKIRRGIPETLLFLRTSRRRVSRASGTRPRIQRADSEEVAGVVSGDCQFVAQRDGFNQTVLQTKQAVSLLRRGIQAAPFDRGEFVVSQYAISIIFLEETEFPRQAAALFALRQKFEAFDKFTDSDSAEKAVAVVETEPGDHAGSRTLLAYFANGVGVEEETHKCRSRAEARSV